jgi:hypothetical protein
MIHQMTWNSSEAYLVRTCRRMAPVDQPRARRIAAGIKKSDVLKGYALGKMADAIVATDRAAAKELLAKSFVVFERAAQRGRDGVWGAESAAIIAGVLLPAAERIDPEHLAETVQRVLALRWFPRTIHDLTMMRPDTSGEDSIEANAALSAILARYDCELAGTIAQSISERMRGPLSEVEDRYLDRGAVLSMLALADPEGTAALIDVIPPFKNGGIGPSRDVPRLIVAEALAAPESEFWSLIRRAVSDLELLERED